MVEVAREKRETAKIEKDAKIELARQERETKIVIDALTQAMHCNAEARPKLANFDSTSSVKVESGQEELESFPEWEDASSITDKAVDSELPAHNGCINVIVARQNLGKSTIAKQFIVEAIEGVSSNLFPFLKGVAGPQWEAYYYASESDPKFKENFGTKLQELKPHFHVLLDNFHFGSVEQALAHIRQAVMKSKGNCVIVLDNITDMFPGITKKEADKFISGLREIRKCVNNQGREVTFFIIVHANRSTGEVAGTAVWENRGEVIFSIEQDKNHNDNDHRIIGIGKNRRGPAYIKFPIKRMMTPYMHFECYSDGDDVTQQETESSDIVASKDDLRKPLTPEVEAFFASLYVENTYGYGRIYNDYKGEYRLKSKNDVRNAIVRAKTRAGVA